MSHAMNMSVFSLMIGIAIAFVALLIYAVAFDHWVLLVAMGAAALFAFAPWHRW